jgi:hypothetical protein
LLAVEAQAKLRPMRLDYQVREQSRGAAALLPCFELFVQDVRARQVAK